MPGWETYKGNLELPATPTEDAGINLKNNFKVLRDNSPKSTFIMTRDPNSGDDFADGWELGSGWLNTADDIAGEGRVRGAEMRKHRSVFLKWGPVDCRTADLFRHA